MNAIQTERKMLNEREKEAYESFLAESGLDSDDDIKPEPKTGIMEVLKEICKGIKPRKSPTIKA